MCNAWKVPIYNLRTIHALISLCISTGWSGPLLSSNRTVDIVVYVEEQKMPKLDCTDVHGDLDLCCWQNALGPFLCIAHHITILPKNIPCGYSLEVLRQSASKEYSNQFFLWRNKKIFTWYLLLSGCVVLIIWTVTPYLFPSIQDASLVPNVGSHPRGSNIHVSWDTVPLGAHPKDGMYSSQSSLLESFCLHF